MYVSRLWQIHIFGEGNTRTTAVFFIKYLRSLGYDATNDIFAQNAWYFRNALVRANYNNLKENIHETTLYLEMFIRNLLLNESNELKNRDLHIQNIFEEKEAELEASGEAITVSIAGRMTSRRIMGKLSLSFPPLHTVHATFIAHGVPSWQNIFYHSYIPP